MAQFQNPFLRGFYGAQQADQQAQAGQLAQLQGVLGIQQALAQQQEMQRRNALAQQYQGVLANLSPDTPQEEIVRRVLPFAGPDAALRTIQGSQDRAAQIQARQEAAAAQREQRLQELEMQHRAREDQIKLAAQEGRITREQQAIADRQNKEYFMRLAAALRPAPAPQPVTPVTIQDPNNPNATVIIDARTRQVIGAGPKLTEAGKADQKQRQTMQGVGAALQQAEDLLMGQKRDSEGNVTTAPLPTGSGIGRAVDIAGSVIGVSPTGAEQAKELEVVGGVLVSKVPRFEGPQSDKDTQLYKQMAADVANATLPRNQRLAALRRMRGLYAQYESGARGRVVEQPATPTTPAPAAPTAPARISSEAEYNALPSGATYIAPDGSTRTKR